MSSRSASAAGDLVEEVERLSPADRRRLESLTRLSPEEAGLVADSLAGMYPTLGNEFRALIARWDELSGVERVAGLLLAAEGLSQLRSEPTSGEPL